jgi:hypothetical protein
MKAWDRDAMTDEERAWYDGTLRGQLDQLRRDAQTLGAVHVGAGIDQLEAKLAEHRDRALSTDVEDDGLG